MLIDQKQSLCFHAPWHLPRPQVWRSVRKLLDLAASGTVGWRLADSSLYRERVRDPEVSRSSAQGKASPHWPKVLKPGSG